MGCRKLTYWSKAEVKALTNGKTKKNACSRYELTNHLSNVLSVVSDRRTGVCGTDTSASGDTLVAFYQADIVSVQDYYPFGMQQPGKKFSSGDYRFGFQGKENINKVSGQGNWQDYGERMYSPRLARFPSADPISAKFPMLSPYQFASLNPIMNIDLDGLEGYPSVSRVIFKELEITTADAKQIEDEFKVMMTKAFRLSVDAAIITGGILSIFASDGATLPVFMGVVATSGGATKFYFDARGEYDKSDAVPTTISGTVMVTANYMVGEEVFSETFRANVEIIEGVATLNFKNFKSLKAFKSLSAKKQANESFLLLNLTIDATSISEDLKGVLLNTNSSSSSQNQDLAPKDNTDVDIKSPLPNDIKLAIEKLKQTNHTSQNKNNREK